MTTLDFDADRETFRRQCARLCGEGDDATGGNCSPAVPGAAPRVVPSAYLRENGFVERLARSSRASQIAAAATRAGVTMEEAAAGFRALGVVLDEKDFSERPARENRGCESNGQCEGVRDT